jgi:hypothetical protein
MNKLPKESLVRFKKQSLGESKIHGLASAKGIQTGSATKKPLATPPV